MEKKHLSSIANDVVQRCAREIDSSVVALFEEFDAEWRPELSNYSRKLVEFCCSKTLSRFCCKIEGRLGDGSFARFTFDMMLAWERPSFTDEDQFAERVGKGKEDKKAHPHVVEQDEDVSLFYSDLMPLLVGNEPSVGEGAFTWMISIVPLIGDCANGRSTFETLTMSTCLRLHFPGYEMFLKEIDRCVKRLWNLGVSGGVRLREDEFILHVDGAAGMPRVVRHIGGTSWPGRLTLSNYAFYFEVSGLMSYKDAFKVSLSDDKEQSVKTSSTGPWGAPIYDKAIVYESSDLDEGFVLEFPELTSSVRRDHWLALINEVILMHRFLKNFEEDEAWEIHARTMLGIIRLHAAREMMRITPPPSNSFLIFSLYEYLPKGDFVLEELAGSLRRTNSKHPCSATLIFRRLMQPHLDLEVTSEEIIERVKENETSSLQTAIHKCREETREMDHARATTEGLKEEGFIDGILVLMELLSPIRRILEWFVEVSMWKRPIAGCCMLLMLELVVFKAWVGKAISVLLFWVVVKVFWLRWYQQGCGKVVVRKGSDKTTIESLVSAQQGLRAVQNAVQEINISILKVRSVLLSRATKHSNTVMVAVVGAAAMLAVVPLRLVATAVILGHFVSKSKLGKYSRSRRSERRIQEWWDSIPVDPVEIVE